MLGLPKSTEFNRRIPKQKFYENLSVTPALKRVFVEQIKVIWWRNKIAATTMNLAVGENVAEIEVFEVCLSALLLDESVLRQIDKEISYHILFYWSMRESIRHGQPIRRQPAAGQMLLRWQTTTTPIGWRKLPCR